MAMGAKLNDFLPFISDNTAKLILTLFRLIAIVGLGYWLWNSIKKQTHPLLNWALALIFAGALGNIIDRFIDGKVTDFLHLEFGSYSFFIFNLADAFITLGAILIIYFEFIYKPKNE